MSDLERQFRAIDQEHDDLASMMDRWVNLGSGSWDEAGLSIQFEALRETFAGLGGSLEAVPIGPAKSETGARRRVLIARKRPNAPVRALLVGHYDTVYPSGRARSSVRRVEGGRYRGPGCADMKGGLAVMFGALRAFEREGGGSGDLGWTVFLNPDEEIGSVWSEPLLVDTIEGHDIGLVYEPSLPDGSLVSARKGSGTFEVCAFGRAAHAGRDPAAGRNAVCLIADFIRMADSLNGVRQGVTVNVGRVEGGTEPNIVPATARCILNVRTAVASDEAWFVRHLEGIIGALSGRDGFRLEWEGAFSTSPKPQIESTTALLETMREIGGEIGMDVRWDATGGSCDGNRLQAAGLPTLDSLGVVGSDLHSEAESMLVASLCERTKMSFALLDRLARGEGPRLARRSVAEAGPGDDETVRATSV